LAYNVDNLPEPPEYRERYRGPNGEYYEEEEEDEE